MRFSSLAPVSGNGLDNAALHLRRLIDDAESLLDSAVDTGDQKLDTLRDDFARQVKQMRAQLEAFEGHSFERMRRTLHKADQAVHSHPYAAMGVVAAVGTLFALLAARR